MGEHLEWADATWNPVRFLGARTALRRTREAPLRWKKPRRIFVNSDLFGEGLLCEEIAEIFGVMAAAMRHTYQVLTKRPQRALEFIDWLFVHGSLLQCQVMNSPALWLGVSVEDQATADKRIPLLLQCPAVVVRFVSYEAAAAVNFAPWLKWWRRGGTAAVTERGLDWLIVGGESGPGARPFDLSWARDTIAQCRAAGVACFVKQLGSKPIDQWADNGAMLLGRAHRPPRFADRKGGDWSEWPEDLRVREFPGHAGVVTRQEIDNGA